MSNKLDAEEWVTASIYLQQYPDNNINPSANDQINFYLVQQYYVNKQLLVIDVYVQAR